MPDGSTHFEARIIPADDQTAYTLVRDITKRRKTEIELIEKNKRLELFFSQSHTGFFFMILNEPVEWSGAKNKKAVLNYVMSNQKMTRVNQAMLDRYGVKTTI